MPVRPGSRRNDTVEADFCICALPFSILKDLDTDLSDDVKQIINNARQDSAYKIAWESRRFWEQEFSIYGGLSFLKQPVNLVWYPSSGLFSNKGILVAGYSVENGTSFEKLDRAAKLESSRNSVEVLHPGYSRELSKPLYVSWGHIPYSLGGWMRHGQAQGFRSSFSGYERAIQPDGPIYLAGDHLSHMVAWQEGAALSAHHAVSLLAKASAER
jgi:monoamine oxidase